MILPIYLWPKAKVLRKQATPILEMTDELKQLAADMQETLVAADIDGLGLAANQVGVGKRMVVVRTGPTAVPRTLVNPAVKSQSKNRMLLREACLSIPGAWAHVWRPEAVVFTAQEWRDGELHAVEEHATGVLARVLQHEIDHLDGLLFFDRLTAIKREFMVKKLKQFHFPEMILYKAPEPPPAELTPLTPEEPDVAAA